MRSKTPSMADVDTIPTIRFSALWISRLEKSLSVFADSQEDLI